MKSRYKILWTDHALVELNETVSYIERNFSPKEVAKLGEKIESTLSLIAAQPKMFPETEHRTGVRKAVIMRLNSMYYRVVSNNIEILSFFSNRQDPQSNEYEN